MKVFLNCPFPFQVHESREHSQRKAEQSRFVAAEHAEECDIRGRAVESGRLHQITSNENPEKLVSLKFV